MYSFAGVTDGGGCGKGVGVGVRVRVGVGPTRLLLVTVKVELIGPMNWPNWSGALAVSVYCPYGKAPPKGNVIDMKSLSLLGPIEIGPSASG